MNHMHLDIFHPYGGYIGYKAPQRFTEACLVAPLSGYLLCFGSSQVATKYRNKYSNRSLPWVVFMGSKTARIIPNKEHDGWAPMAERPAPHVLCRTNERGISISTGLQKWTNVQQMRIIETSHVEGHNINLLCPKIMVVVLIYGRTWPRLTHVRKRNRPKSNKTVAVSCGDCQIAIMSFMVLLQHNNPTDTSQKHKNPQIVHKLQFN